MKQNRSVFIGWQGVILALMVILCGLFEMAYCQDIASAEGQLGTDTTVLLMQQPDSRAGAVTPDIGVHYFDVGAEVLLTAVPKPSYYFVYWIGDVSDPTANSTIVYLDAPKIVVAVFARSEFAFSLEEMMTLGGGGGGGLRSSAVDYSHQGYGGGGPGRPREYPVTPPPKKPSGPKELPDEFPIPSTPEPATVMLLGLGSLIFVRRKTKR